MVFRHLDLVSFMILFVSSKLLKIQSPVVILHSTRQNENTLLESPDKFMKEESLKYCVCN